MLGWDRKKQGDTKENDSNIVHVNINKHLRWKDEIYLTNVFATYKLTGHVIYSAASI